MKLLTAMPRATDTSLFTSRMTQSIVIGLSVIGFVLVTLVLYQNFLLWKNRKAKIDPADTNKKQITTLTNRDLFSAFAVCLIIMIVFVIFFVFILSMFR